MSRAGSVVAASQRGDEPWLAADAASKPLSKADALARPDAVLQEAIALVTATHTASLRKRRGDAGGVDIGDLHVATYDRHQCALLLQDLSQASGMLTKVDANGDVSEDYNKMNAFASDVLESCFASVQLIVASCIPRKSCALNVFRRTAPHSLDHSYVSFDHFLIS